MHTITYRPFDKPKYIGVNGEFFAIHGICECGHPDFKHLNFGREHQTATLVMKHPQHSVRCFNFEGETHDSIIEKAQNIVNNYKYENYIIND